MKNLTVLLIDAKAVLDSLNIPYGTISSISVASNKSVWGTCHYSYRTDTYSIQISPLLLDDAVPYDAVMNTVIHEVLHAYKDRMCHTGEWKRCANIINNAYPRFNIKRSDSCSEKQIPDSAVHRESVKYIITCDKCGAISKYRRKTKTVEDIMNGNQNKQYKCGRCNSYKFSVKTD